MNILKSFLKYISIDTTSDSSKSDTPSSEGQRKLAKILIDELECFGLDMIYYDEKHCYIYALLKGNEKLPKIGFLSHLDTSDDCIGKNIMPNIIYNYDGEDIVLKDNIVISTDDYPDLKKHIGKTLITTDGTTLLGADNKAGITEIMYMLKYFSNSTEEHGDIFVCFTPDEEIGLGTLHLDKTYFNPNFAYTVDGKGLGEFSYENFNAATAKIDINGILTHYGTAKDVMINAGRIATIVASMIPNEIPENTEGQEGFYHLKEIKGNISTASMIYLICDFNKINFEKRKQVLYEIVEDLNKKYNNSIELNIESTYRNMLDIMNDEKDMIQSTLKVMKKIGIKPNVVANRGGTDGTTLTFSGIPCPNLGTGVNNYHSVYEYICLEDMEKTIELLIELVKYFSNK